MDTISSGQRSHTMRAVKGKDTKPELLVRRMLHALGFRFRLHRKDLPGNPDIVLPKFRTIIFVHGCFWHQHPECRRALRPTSRCEYWDKKLNSNIRRDLASKNELERLGWQVHVIWECEIKNNPQAAKRLAHLLRGLN